MIYVYSNNGRHPVINNFTQLHHTYRHFNTSPHLNFTQLPTNDLCDISGRMCLVTGRGNKLKVPVTANVFWGVTTCSAVKMIFLLCNSKMEEGIGKFIGNVGRVTPDHTSQRLRKTLLLTITAAVKLCVIVMPGESLCLSRNHWITDVKVAAVWATCLNIRSVWLFLQKYPLFIFLILLY
jgi:hypothetical protein